MGNDLSIMRTLILTLFASFVLLLSDAVAAPDSNLARPTSLCSSGEVVLFSCDIGGKKLSLCGIKDGCDRPLLVQYRFGYFGTTPELEYPSKASEALSAFDFGTVDNTSGFPLQSISFNMPGVAYDIMTPDKSDYARWAPFTGVGVTVRGKTTTLLECEKGTISVDLAPLRKALGLPADGRLSDALPKYPLETVPYPIVHKKRPCGSNCKCEIEYPNIGDPVVATEIKAFIKGDCEDGDETVIRVTATIARVTYLTLSFSHYRYSYGTPHGYAHEGTKLFRKGKKGWEPLKKENLLDLKQKCKERINGLLYRQLKPQRLSHLDSENGLLDSAAIMIGSQGLIFSYGQYELGSYAEGPLPVLLSYKMLGGCLRIDR